ncbi:hypothetical protein HMSSN139_28800 [Paenibacillus sp. HMSSN-139]|nr:hypothetical protein HMSSN139_28800 [Paenibacillus sp. HMSSN-139]
MGNNLVAWESPSGYDGADTESLLNRTDMATYTYRNLIVTVTQNAKTKADISTTKKAVKVCAKFIRQILWKIMFEHSIKMVYTGFVYKYNNRR